MGWKTFLSTEFYERQWRGLLDNASNYFFGEEDIDQESKGKKGELTGNHRIE